MLNTLIIYTNESVNSITATNLRKAIISMIDKIDPSKKDLILFHIPKETMENKETPIRKIPHILFGKPRGYQFRIHGYNETGLNLLKEINKNLHHTFSLQGKTATIKKTHFIQNSYIPKKSPKAIKYKTITPIQLFTKEQRKIFDSIVINTKDNDLKETQLKEETNKLIIKNLKYQMQQLFKRKEYKIFEKIEINWTTFKTIKIKDKNLTQIAIVGEFTTDHELPTFIGRRIGNGFGEIAKVSNIKPNSKYHKKAA